MDVHTQLRSENSRLKSALEKSVAGIVVFDLKESITFVNATWAAMHGYSSDELLGKSMKIFYSKVEYKKFVERLEKVKAGKNLSLEVVHRKKDGTSVPIWARLLATKDSAGAPNGFVISALNLSRQKRHEKELERLNKLFINRELKMVELKKRIRKLEGKPPKPPPKI